MRRLLFSALITSFIVPAGMHASVAQTADSGPSSLQEIIVTAQKRPENVNSVPIVMTVLTNQDLVEAGINNTQQLEWVTPGLVFGNTNGFAQPYIRGIGTDLIGPGQDSPVGFYLDGVYLPWTPRLIPIGTGHLSTTATYYHNSGFYFDAGDEIQQKAYNLANLYVQYAPQENRGSVAAWINNAFNATVVAGIGTSPYVLAAQYVDPRLFGLSATVHY
jgi:hypothetical protein